MVEVEEIAERGVGGEVEAVEEDAVGGGAEDVEDPKARITMRMVTELRRGTRGRGLLSLMVDLMSVSEGRVYPSLRVRVRRRPRWTHDIQREFDVAKKNMYHDGSLHSVCFPGLDSQVAYAKYVV
jgi:hypothetical protein